MNLPESESKRLIETIASTLDIDCSQMDLSKERRNYPEWDSLKHLEVMLAIESEFKIRFTSLELTQTTEPSEIQSLVERHFFQT